MQRQSNQHRAGIEAALLAPVPLPFYPQGPRDDATLRRVLRSAFIKPAIIWMSGQRGERVASRDPLPTVEVETVSCSWAVALYLEAFIQAYQMTDIFDESERQVLAQYCDHLAHFLIESQLQDHSWDNAPWDTSVVCHALLTHVVAAQMPRAGMEVESSFSATIRQKTQAAFLWTVDQAINWESVRYPFGPEDLAMILGATCLIQRTNVIPGIVGQHRRLESNLDLVKYLVERLMRAQTSSMTDGSLNRISWGSAFSTAHVLRTLTEATDLVSGDLRDRCIHSLIGAITQIEQDQEEGQWGLPNSTSMILHSYVSACLWLGQHEDSVVSAVKPLPEILFKALRWLTDEKQRFSDGSILHTFTHTTFFVLMLEYITARVELDLLDYAVPQLYDFVIWDSQVRPSRERSERLAVTETIITLNARLQHFQRLSNQLINVARIAIAGGVCAAFVEAGINFRWISFSPPPLAILDVQSLLTALGFLVSFLSAFWLFSRRWLHSTNTNS